MKVAFPFEVSASAICPTLLPINALPKGDASEIFPSRGLASDGLTKVYFDFFFFKKFFWGFGLAFSGYFGSASRASFRVFRAWFNL